MNRFLGSLVERFSDLTDLREELCRFQNEFSGAKPKSPDLQRQSGERAENLNKCSIKESFGPLTAAKSNSLPGTNQTDQRSYAILFKIFRR